MVVSFAPLVLGADEGCQLRRARTALCVNCEDFKVHHERLAWLAPTSSANAIKEHADLSRLPLACGLPFVLLKSGVGDAMLAESACEYGAAIHRFGCVISHTFIVVLLPRRALDNRCATFLQETLSPAWSAVGAILAF